MTNLVRLSAMSAALALAASGASAHVGVSDSSSFAAGFAHPLSGLDHVAVMIAVGLWAALTGGRALWVWPAAFVGVMLAGGALGMAALPLPFVEPAILASVLALGLLVALAIDLPVGTGAAIVGLFALFHGHAHGAEAPETTIGLTYMAGFAIATALLHGVGVVAGVGLGQRYRTGARGAGVACVAIGVGLFTGAL